MDESGYEVETYVPSGAGTSSGLSAVKVSDPNSGCYVVCQRFVDVESNRMAAVMALDQLLRYPLG
jgi:hypothetical protein